jgi:hypothetical protein
MSVLRKTFIRRFGMSENRPWREKMNSEITKYTEVQLAKSLPDFGFEMGDAATIVEVVKDLHNHIGYVLEFFDNEGKTLKIVTVDESSVKLIQSLSVDNYRPYLAA